MADTAMERLVRRIRESERAVWVFCGDSITHGALHTEGLRDYVELVAERVRYELGKTLHLFVNSGISGDTTRGVLEHLEHRVLRFDPDIFSLMIGMNDCADGRKLGLDEFGGNLREIVRRVRDGGDAEVLLQTTCAVHPEETQERAGFAQYMQVIREVSEDLDAALIDHQAAWEETRLAERARFDSWMANAFHPNALGHWMFAERLLRDLGLGPLENCSAPA